MSSGSRNAERVRHQALTFVICMVLWLLLTASLAPAELVAGLAVSALAVLFSRDRAPVLGGIRLYPGAVAAFLLYVASFTRALVMANLDMARRVLSPRIPLRPEMIRIRTGLASGLGRLALANSITLTPGTLTVDVEEDELTVHWVDCPPDADLQTLTEQVAGEFEQHLKGFLQ